MAVALGRSLALPLRLATAAAVLAAWAACAPPGADVAAGTAGGPAAEPPRTIRVPADFPLDAAPPGAPTAPGNLQRALAGVSGPAILLLEVGHHVVLPASYTDPTCGNCEDAAEAVRATAGLIVSGDGIEIRGVSADSVVIRTNAGYGILFEDCRECALSEITVTGGTRDEDGRATSAAVVARSASLLLQDCRVRDNVGDSATVAQVVVGIAGVAGREGSELRVERCRIERNSWDGIVLYRGARAEIRDNVIDGVDLAVGAQIGGGRGVGIGLTWDAEATIEGNLVRRYWKGIGVFVDARATVRHNIVEDIRTWGIAYWAAGDGRPVAVIEENVVYRTGACGVMLDRASPLDGDPGHLRGNLLVRTNQDPGYDSGQPYCVQRPIARHAVPEGFGVGGNVVHGARQPGDAPREPELGPAEALEAAAPLLQRLVERPALRGSTFLREFPATASR